MRKSGFIVRFVDVVLILLFGFISISSIRETEVELPTSTETPPAPPETQEIVFVGITSDGSYLVRDEQLRLEGPAALYRFLSDYVDDVESAPVKVRLRASHDTPMGFLVEASRVCDALGVDRAFEVLVQQGRVVLP